MEILFFTTESPFGSAQGRLRHREEEKNKRFSLRLCDSVVNSFCPKIH
jgi:hypothetical protein